jgi:autotransporter strand-loop-strand O-heptosyltransferase
MNKVLVGIGYPLGDVIAAIPYVDKYTRESGHDVYTKIGNPYHQQFFTKSYPAIQFCDGTSTFDRRFNLLPNFARPLQQDFAEQLEFSETSYIRPIVDRVNKPRPIQNRYAVIGLHSTSQLKYWNHPGGLTVQSESPYWDQLSVLLRKVGITPVVVEKDELFGIPPYRNGMPKHAQKKLGVNLLDTMNLLEHAEFFIGLSSGLAWLAHGLGTKVAMISNFTEDWYEFGLDDPSYIRITNKEVCHGCFNRVGIDFPFGKDDWYWCPRHKGTDRQFECHTTITPEMVFEQIKKWL